LEDDWPQCDYSTTCITAQQFSAASVALSLPQEKLGVCFKTVVFSIYYLQKSEIA
jgi:hypothetical protein